MGVAALNRSLLVSMEWSKSTVLQHTTIPPSLAIHANAPLHHDPCFPPSSSPRIELEDSKLVQQHACYQPAVIHGVGIE